MASVPPADVTRVPLAPLSRAAVSELAGDADGEALYAATGGNPFLVTESLAGRRATVRDAVLARAARLSPAARRVLELVSVVPGRAELWLLGEPRGDALDAVAECEASGLLVADGDAVRFRHELARRAYRESLSALRGIELNRTVLRRLEERGAEPARLVHHAEAAQEHAALTRYALVAADRAVAARSHREAVDLLDPRARARGAAHSRAAGRRVRDALDRGVHRRAQRRRAARPPQRARAAAGARGRPRGR